MKHGIQKSLLLVLVAALGACGKTSIKQTYKEKCNVEDGLYQSMDGNEPVQIYVEGDIAQLGFGGDWIDLEIDSCSVLLEGESARIKDASVDSFALVGEGGRYEFFRIEEEEEF